MSTSGDTECFPWPDLRPGDNDAIFNFTFGTLMEVISGVVSSSVCSAGVDVAATWGDVRSLADGRTSWGLEVLYKTYAAQDKQIRKVTMN